MKRKYILTGVTALILSACGGGAGGGLLSGSDIETDEAKAAKTVTIADEDGAPQCSISLQVIFAKGDDERAQNINHAIQQRLFMFDSLKMQQAVDSFANFYTSEYRKNMAPLYREDRGDEAKHAWYQYRYEIKTETREGKDDCLVYIVDLDMYEGGAHGIRQQLAMNFDAQTGRLITYDDIFAQGYQYRLREMLLDELKRQTETNSLDELHAKDYLLTMDIYAPRNFILGDDEITFIYNPYEIAPCDKGNTELTLSYGKLREIMK